MELPLSRHVLSFAQFNLLLLHFIYKLDVVAQWENGCISIEMLMGRIPFAAYTVVRHIWLYIHLLTFSIIHLANCVAWGGPGVDTRLHQFGKESILNCLWSVTRTTGISWFDISPHIKISHNRRETILKYELYMYI